MGTGDVRLENKLLTKTRRLLDLVEVREGLLTGGEKKWQGSLQVSVPELGSGHSEWLS